MKTFTKSFAVTTAVTTLIITLLSVGVLTSSAFYGSKSADHEAMQNAIEEVDYQTWHELASAKCPANIITEDNFDEFVEAHKLMREGDFEAAQEIMTELGLEMPGHRRGGEHGFGQKPAELDYETWSEIMTKRGQDANFITEENFAKMQEMHELMQSGDREAAQEIADELGLKRPNKDWNNNRNGLKNFKNK